jgi:2-polyprenyl-3-methyl-5-hydroxy-6-metoxy-1,4-benzoquinol methylase
MNANRVLWEKGDFTQIAAFMRQSGEAVIQSTPITPPVRVLDPGCGDGTTAIPLARTGAEVIGYGRLKMLSIPRNPKVNDD